LKEVIPSVRTIAYLGDRRVRWLLQILTAFSCSLALLLVRRDKSSEFKEIGFHLPFIGRINLLRVCLIVP